MQKKFTLRCDCGEELIWCCELKHRKTGRTIFECKKCKRTATFRNKNNFDFRT